MLTQEDLKQIGGLLTENNKVLKTELKTELKAELVPEIIGQVGEMIEQNIMPQFDALHVRVDGLRDEMRQGFDALGRRLDRTDGKVNTLVNVLQEKRVITEADRRRVLS